MIRGIHHIGINCRDIDRMKRFYIEAFASKSSRWLRLGERAVDGPYRRSAGSAARGVMLRAGTCYIELFQYSAPPPGNDGPLRPQDRGYTHFCVDVTEIEKDMAHLKACGMTFTGRDLADAGHVKTLYGYDPEGNVIEVQQCTPGNGFTLEDLPEQKHDIAV